MRIIPVIHIREIGAAIEQVRLVQSLGLDTVALIQMHAKDAYVDSTKSVCADEFPKMKIIVNYLGEPNIHTAASRAIMSGANGLWVDNAGAEAGQPTEELVAAEVLLQGRTNFDVFAGFNFKYQISDSNPAASMKLLQDMGFIPCTSGRGTGEAPDLDYIVGLRKAVPTGRLAVASGITPANVTKYNGLLTDVLVATGISKSFYEIDPTKLEAMLEALHR